MKKLMILAVFALTAIGASAQKFALLDMEYILKNIPAYERCLLITSTHSSTAY